MNFSVLLTYITPHRRVLMVVLGLLLAVPLASCGKTFLDAWAVRLRAGEAALAAADGVRE